MDTTLIDTLRECAHGSLAGRMTFPEVAGKLMARGIETYHTDLYRREHTYYLPSGESHIEPLEIAPAPIGPTFSPEAVAVAVRASQRGQLAYRDFLISIMAAGTTHYFVYLAGRCVVYTGRDGSEHVERFPTAV